MGRLFHSKRLHTKLYLWMNGEVVRIVVGDWQKPNKDNFGYLHKAKDKTVDKTQVVTLTI